MAREDTEEKKHVTIDDQDVAMAEYLEVNPSFYAEMEALELDPRIGKYFRDDSGSEGGKKGQLFDETADKVWTLITEAEKAEQKEGEHSGDYIRANQLIVKAREELEKLKQQAEELAKQEEGEQEPQSNKELAEVREAFELLAQDLEVKYSQKNQDFTEFRRQVADAAAAFDEKAPEGAIKNIQDITQQLQDAEKVWQTELAEQPPVKSKEEVLAVVQALTNELRGLIAANPDISLKELQDAQAIFNQADTLDKTDPMAALVVYQQGVAQFINAFENFKRQVEQKGQERAKIDEVRNAIAIGWKEAQRLLPRNVADLFNPEKDEDYTQAVEALKTAKTIQEYETIIAALNRVKTRIDVAVEKGKQAQAQKEQQDKERQENRRFFEKIDAIFVARDEFLPILVQEAIDREGARTQADRRRIEKRVRDRYETIDAARLISLRRLINQYGQEKMAKLPANSKRLKDLQTALEALDDSGPESIAAMLEETSSLSGKVVADNFNNPDRSYTVKTKLLDGRRIKYGIYIGWYRGFIRLEVESSSPDDWERIKNDPSKRAIRNIKSIGSFKAESGARLYRLIGSLEGLPHKDDDRLLREQGRKKES